MRLRQTIQNLFFIASIGIISIYADDGNEFNIAPSSPLDADFFDNDIPASYLAGKDDRTAINYAIIESGPSENLQEDEIYIENIPITYTKTAPIRQNQSSVENGDLYPAAAGIFLDDSGEVIIPENLVSIESCAQSGRSKAIALASSNQVVIKKNTPEIGEFVTDETNGVTAKPEKEDRYNGFPDGSFTIGYQLMYMHYNEDEAACETIYNGIMADYTYYAANDLVLKASVSLLGGAIFNKDNGSIYSDNALTLGRKFSLTDKKLFITPYFGIGLRYQNNVFAGNNATERDTLQVYIPVGLRTEYTPNDRLKVFGDFEASIIALNQNWTNYTTGYDSTTASFNGFSTMINLGAEYMLNDSLTIGAAPYYKYIYTGKKSSSPVGHTDTHMIGLNAYIKF